MYLLVIPLFIYLGIFNCGLFYDSTNDRNEYQEYFLKGKGGRCLGLITLPPSCTDCLEMWEPKPHRTLRACPGLYRKRFSFTSLTTLSTVQAVRMDSEELLKKVEAGSRSLPSTSFTGGI